MKCKSSISFCVPALSHSHMVVDVCQDVCSTQLHGTYVRSSRDKFLADRPEPQNLIKSALTELNLKQNKIGDEGGCALAAALRATPLCCAHDVLVAVVRALFLQCVLLVNCNTVFLARCARDGVRAVHNPSTSPVCTETFDSHTATVDAAVRQQMAYENTNHCSFVTVRAMSPPTCA